jgi:D-alanyl-D-alanine carboxypeptidase
VSRSTPLSDKNYAPLDLISISGSLINQAGRNSFLRKDARDALWMLASAFEKKFAIPLTVISGYRSSAYQQRLWDLGRCRDSLCAPPGYSEHQLGLAVDLFDATSENEFTSNPTYRKYIKWLRENAHLYGWTQSYQKWIEIDGYDIEPWHYRYLGTTLATRLHNLGWTYTEFVKFQEDIQRK